MQWHLYPRFGIVGHFPLHVDIELSTNCNMSCPMCYRRTQKFTDRVKPQLMEEDVFKKIIDEAVVNRLFSIRLSLRGEPLLHPKIFDFIEEAKSRGIPEVSMLSNGLALDNDRFKKLIELGFDWLTLSVDGLDSTYESIRKPAKFEELLKKIKSFSELKKQHRSRKPVLRIQSVWPAIKNDPRRFYETFSPYVDSITSNPMIDFLQQDSDVEYDRDYVCPYLYQRVVIAADGKVLLCSFDDYEYHIIGDVKKETIYNIWHGKPMSEARAWFKEKTKKWWENEPCKHCCYPRKKERAGQANMGKRNIEVQKYVNRKDEIDYDNEHAKKESISV
ncbi:radical SAM/SPASM domain-containing protein [Candidatus Omnitrophota bacterium]